MCVRVGERELLLHSATVAEGEEDEEDEEDEKDEETDWVLTMRSNRSDVSTSR